MTGQELVELEVPWLPTRETHWQLSPVKRHFDVLLGKMLQPKKRSPEDVQVPYLKAQHIQWDKVVTQDLPTMWATPEEVSSLRVRKGDLLVCEGGEVGRATIVTGDLPEDCIIQNALHLVRPKKSGDVRFLRYVLRHATSQEWLDVLCNRATIAHFTVEKFSEMWVWLPPLSQQRTIADFLDRETAKIDELILEKERLLELLAEKRRALITHAVTRGFDPDVPMRDSGVEWLGEIPEHWSVRRLRHISPFLTVGVVVNPSTYVTDHGVPFLFGSDVTEEGINTADSRCIPEEISDGELSKTRLRAGDLVTVRVGYPGITAVVPSELEGANCASMMLIRQASSFDSFWLCYAMNSGIGRCQIEQVQYGAAQKQFNISHAVDFFFPFPPLLEQRSISYYLDKETARLSGLTSIVRKNVELLHERRTALISAAVTGQIRAGTES